MAKIKSGTWEVREGTNCLLCGRKLDITESFQGVQIAGKGFRYFHNDCVMEDKNEISTVLGQKKGEQGSKGFEFKITIQTNHNATFEQRAQLKTLCLFPSQAAPNTWEYAYIFGNIQKLGKMLPTILTCLNFDCNISIDFRLNHWQQWLTATPETLKQIAQSSATLLNGFQSALATTTTTSESLQHPLYYEIMDFIRLCKEIALIINGKVEQIKSYAVYQLMLDTLQGKATFQRPERNKGRV